MLVTLHYISGSDNGINHKSKEVFSMVNSISRQEIVEVVEKARDYFVPILAPKTIGYYKGVWDKLIAYADESPDKSNVDVRAFYRMVFIRTYLISGFAANCSTLRVYCSKKPVS